MSIAASLAVRIYSVVARVIPFHRQPFASIYSTLYFAYKRLLEDPFASLAAARPELFRGGDVIDGGANIGYTTLLFARSCDAGATVHAFEPDPGNVATLRRNAGRSPVAARVRIRAAALGATTGRVSLWHNREHPGDHRVMTPALASRARKIIEVDLVTLDGEVTSPVAFIKLDVQGFELEVSRGMQGLLACNEDVVVALELMPQALQDAGADPAELLAFYTSRRFLLHRLDQRGRVTRAAAEELLKEARANEYVNVLCARREL